MAVPVVKSYSASDFFGDLVGTARDLGKGYLDFSWEKYKFDEELQLATKYNQAVNQQAATNTPAASKKIDYVKYGMFGLGGLVVLLIMAKALK